MLLALKSCHRSIRRFGTATTRQFLKTTGPTIMLPDRFVCLHHRKILRRKRTANWPGINRLRKELSPGPL